MYYTVTTVDPTGVETKHDKINHSTAILTINALLEAYGFSRPITKNTFNSILCRPDKLPDRLKWLLNNKKLIITRCGFTPERVNDILEFINALPRVETENQTVKQHTDSNKRIYGLAKAMYG